MTAVLSDQARARPLLEICAFTPGHALAAAAAGADRIEFCREPAADGLTPHTTDLRTVAELLDRIPVHPIVRPRASLTAGANDLELMAATIDLVRELGFPGLVLGILNGDAPDWSALAELLPLCSGMDVTFHRAFDLITDQGAALPELAAMGVTRVLTSGRPGRASDHLSELQHLRPIASGAGVALIAGGGIDSDNVAAVLATGVGEVHSSAGGSAGRFNEAEVGRLLDSVAAHCR